MDALEKLEVLARSARYDVSCASSGVRPQAASGGCSGGPGLGPGRYPGAGRYGSAVSGGICHSFAADGRCVALLKVLLTNVCINDCAYCVNRRSADVPRASFRPEELIRLTEAFYRRNYIEGLFLSSGVIGTPDLTMELMIRVVRKLRQESGFDGYVHMKVIPGCSPGLVREAGLWADRLSVNIELPSDASLRLLAPDKQGRGILAMMRYIGGLIEASADRRLPAPRPAHPLEQHGHSLERGSGTGRFAPAGQSTQLVVGASPESDLAILGLAQSLYGHYRLRRVYYSAFAPVRPDPRLPAIAGPPLRREHRLYEADWLLRFYGFHAEELVQAGSPFLDLDLDPKSAWALRHLDGFPVEVNRASYEELLRVPGIGQKSARRIVDARRHGAVRLETLGKIGVVVKRARWFVAAGGRTLERTGLSSDRLRQRLRQPGTRAEENGQLPLFAAEGEGPAA